LGVSVNRSMLKAIPNKRPARAFGDSIRSNAEGIEPTEWGAAYLTT